MKKLFFNLLLLAVFLTVIPEYSQAQEYLTKYNSRNYSEALPLMEKAADNGDGQALYYLGLVYQYGRGVEKDMQQARMHYEKAAAKGHDEAMNN
ncbi:MAG: sel1 repeat family protein, partial [Balneolaceae bacterium]|nr:sel1 repeat family protein [Balneolaceae bacterium]